MNEFERNELSIETCYLRLSNIKFGHDPANSKHYISSRLSEDDFYALFNIDNTENNPNTYAELQKCTPTSISVERAFSIANSIWDDNRNFSDNNFCIYFTMHYIRNFLNKIG